MRKYTLFVIAASIILLTVAGLSACGEAVPSPQTSQEVSPAPVTSTPTPTPPETATATPTAPAPTPSGGQVVLAEMFTGDWWGYCPFAARAIEQLARELGPGKLLVLQYHSGDKYATPETEARVKEYNVQGFPTMFFNGGNSVVGGGTGNYGQYSAVVNKELTKHGSLTIGEVMTSSGGKISLDVTIANTSVNDITNVRLMAVVYEDLGIDEHHYVVRDILPPSEIASVSSGQKQTFNLSADFPGSLSSLKAVVFLQSPSGQVLQSAIATAE